MNKRKTSEHHIDRFTEAMEEFLLEAEPVVGDLKAMTADIEEKLKELILYYGEDPTMIKSEEFFDIISKFSDSFEVIYITKKSKDLQSNLTIQRAQVEIHEARERALRRQLQQEMQIKVMFIF